MIDAPVDSVATPKVSIDWFRSTPWWRIVSQSLGISWRLSHLVLCAAALLLTQWFGLLTYTILGPDQLNAPLTWVSYSKLPAPLLPVSTLQSDDSEIASMLNPIASHPAWPNPISVLDVWRSYGAYVYIGLTKPTLKRTAFGLVNFIFVVVLWSFVGGCLARRSLVELGTRISAPWNETIRLVLKRWQSIAWSVTMPLGLVALCCIVPLVLGWVSNIPWVGSWIAGLLMIPVVLLSIGLGWCAAISLFGFPLSVCAVACEKQADAFDGVSRAAAYTFQRPLTLILCVAVAELIGRAGGSMVSIVLSTGFMAVSAAFDIGSTASIGSMGSMWDGILSGIVPLVIAAFAYSFFWTAAAATYLILRRDVDHAEFDLIDMDPIAEPKPLPSLPTNDLELSKKADLPSEA